MIQNCRCSAFTAGSPKPCSSGSSTGPSSCSSENRFAWRAQATCRSIRVGQSRTSLLRTRRALAGCCHYLRPRVHHLDEVVATERVRNVQQHRFFREIEPRRNTTCRRWAESPIPICHRGTPSDGRTCSSRRRASRLGWLYAIVNRSPEPLDRLRPDLPADLLRIVHRALVKDPIGRYQQAEQILADLRSCQNRLSTASLQALPTSGRPASIAILPFANLSPEPEQEYFCDGMTEEVIRALGLLEGIRVAAHRAGKQSHLYPAQIRIPPSGSRDGPRRRRRPRQSIRGSLYPLATVRSWSDQPVVSRSRNFSMSGGLTMW